MTEGFKTMDAPQEGEIEKRYPKLVAIAHSRKNRNRLFNHWLVENGMRDPEAYYAATYGEFAPTYRDIIDKVLSESDIQKPRIVILGAWTPATIKGVVAFTSIYKPSKIVVADKDPDSIRFAKEYDLDVSGVVCDFMKDSSKSIPEYDIAIADRTLSYNTTVDDAENVKIAADFIINVASNLTPGGVIVLVDYAGKLNGEDFDRETYIFDHYGEVNYQLGAYDLAITEVGVAKHFKSQPSYEELSQREYPKDRVKKEGRMKYMVVRKLK